MAWSVAFPMHWWHDWWGAVLNLAAGLIVLAGAIAVINKLWQWFIGKHDVPVLGVLEDRARRARLMGGPVVPMDSTIAEIDAIVNRGQETVHRSLLTVERPKKVFEYRTGWSLYPSNEPMLAPAGRFKPRWY